MRFWLWLKDVIRRLFYKRKRPMWPEDVAELPVLESEVEESLARVQWQERDVLVGSLGSPAQLADNLQWNYYYVPACYLEEDDFPIRYVAIYQSWNLFGENSGIRHYGEVVGVEKVQRQKIRFPVVRDNGEELYYHFHIKQWKTLPDPVAVRDAWVSEPRFTNLFLLEHSRHSFELFGIRSEQDFRLMNRLKPLLHETAPEISFACKTGPDRALVLENGNLTVIDRQSKILDRITVENFRQTPYTALQRLRRATKV